jgi:hypothetical protein
MSTSRLLVVQIVVPSSILQRIPVAIPISHSSGLILLSNANATCVGSTCDDPVEDWRHIDWRSDKMGTCPSAILQNEMALSRIHSSDLWVLLTDGEVWEGEVQQLASLGQEKAVFSSPTILLITSVMKNSPNDANVSVVSLLWF